MYLFEILRTLKITLFKIIETNKIMSCSQLLYFDKMKTSYSQRLCYQHLLGQSFPNAIHFVDFCFNKKNTNECLGTTNTYFLLYSQLLCLTTTSIFQMRYEQLKFQVFSLWMFQILLLWFSFWFQYFNTWKLILFILLANDC